ncbi:MAG: capsid cement protein [Planctomycetota bacterium]
MATKVLYPAGCAQIPSPKDAPSSGEVLSHAAYGAVVVHGLRLTDVKVGDPIEVTHGKGPTVEMPSASATLFAEGDPVDHENATGYAVVDAAGDFSVGAAAAAKAAGQTAVKVVLG